MSSDQVTGGWLETVDRVSIEQVFNRRSSTLGRFDRELVTVRQHAVKDLPSTVSFRGEFAITEVFIEGARNQFAERFRRVKIRRNRLDWILG